MLLAVVGATGVGKSEFALDAAEALAARGIMAICCPGPFGPESGLSCGFPRGIHNFCG